MTPIQPHSSTSTSNSNSNTIAPTDTLWGATATLPRFAPLHGDASADVCVIGAGIAGLSTAYMLLRDGRSVIVIDAHGVGAGQSAYSTAHFAPPDERYVEIERGFGAETAALVADSYRQATDCAEAIIRTEKIVCDFERVDGYLFNPSGQWDEVLEREYAVTSRLGLDVIRRERVPGLPFDTGPCLRFARQAQFHPLKYLDGLARAIVRMGARICDDSRALGVQADGAYRRVRTAAGSIRADAVVIATNTPFNATMHAASNATNNSAINAATTTDRAVSADPVRQTPWRSYVVALRVPRDALPHQLLFDTGDPYHHVRLASGGSGVPYELLLVGGLDHPAADELPAGPRYAALELWARTRFPFAGEVQHRWSGEVQETADGLPYLGHNVLDHKNVFVITGGSGNGMTHCLLGAMLVTDLIVGRTNRWSALYAPSRPAFGGMGSFITEQANTFSQYSEWMRGGDVASAGEIARGEGALLRDGGRLLAVYRGEDGGLQALSAACTHQGCAVRWNSAEKSWDCRCHGSRYSALGAVLHGPARRPLTPTQLEDEDADADVDVNPDPDDVGHAAQAERRPT